MGVADGDEIGLERIDREKNGRTKLIIAMGKERSKSLHNFTLPCSLKWGNQRLLRCMKVDSNGDADGRPSAAVLEVDESSFERCQGKTTATERERLTERSKERLSVPLSALGSLNLTSNSKAEKDGGIEEVRAKLMFDLQTTADKMKDAIFREGLGETPQPTTVSNAAEADAMAARPWNLKTRRSACKAPSGGENVCGGANGLNVDAVPRQYFSPVRTEGTKSPTSMAAAIDAPSPAKRQRAEFSVSLLKHEIEEDFMAIAGRRPRRRPKKRSKSVQQELDYLFPGLGLTEINADIYKVPDASDIGKLTIKPI